MPEWILFVDDEPDMEEMIRQQFRKQIREEKFHFAFAQNGKIALEKLKENEDLCLVVTDLNMPEMDGLTLLGELEKLNRPLRTMVVSAYGDLKNIRSAMNRGAFDFVTKPIDFQDFETTLQKTILDIENLRLSIKNQKELEEERQKRMEAQEEGLKILEKSALMLSEVNVMLEAQVQERTKELLEKNDLLKGEIERSESLLLNILPFHTAQELKQYGKAEARFFEKVTVMFTDFRGFTKIAERLTPAELVEEIDICYKAFDSIIEKFGIEKIKTIGDSYMAAAGLPVPDPDHALKVVSAAMEIHQYMAIHQAERKAKNRPVFEIRIGINSGSVVAGIVGSKKFAYDIWGDAVNLASRMESACETGRINISEETYTLIKDQFSCSYRGEIEAKNKGMVAMYYVDSRKPETNSPKPVVSMNFEGAKNSILERLKNGLPSHLSYHNLDHILDVTHRAEALAKMEGLNEANTTLLLTAALYHDSGFLENTREHEEVSCKIAREALPGFGYSEKEIETICEMILATRIPQNPKTKEAEILCDADLDYLGRDDFEKIGDTLFQELKQAGTIQSVDQWNRLQVDFLTQHHYFTQSARQLRQAKKDQHLAGLMEKITQ
jgi:adenylate cyclase